MKKSASTGANPTLPKKSSAPRHLRTDPAKSPARSTSLRGDVITPSSPATSEPPHPPGPVPLRRVRFGYFNPEARDVHVVGSFNGWNTTATPMRRDSLGDWSIEVELPPGEHRYRFVVDGEWRDDPTAQQTALNAFGSFDAIMVVV